VFIGVESNLNPVPNLVSKGVEEDGRFQRFVLREY